MVPASETQKRIIPAEITRLDILVLLARDNECNYLVRELQRTRARVQQLWPIPDPIPDADVLVASVAPGLPARLPWVPGSPCAALIGIVGGAPIDLDLIKLCAVDAVLHRPFEAQAIVVSLLQAWSHFAYERRLRARIDKLEETLRSIRTVERAKSILVRTRQLGEDEAYDLMRRQAMERRVSVGMVAAAIVDSHQILG
jgi:hypothetical protein